MEIVLYKNNSPYNKLNKDIITVNTVQGDFNGEVNITSPEVILNYNDDNFNYIYVLNRYYFVREKIRIRNNMMRIYCDEDYLMSFKNELLNLDVIVNRNENIQNSYLYDNLENTLVKKQVITKVFPNSFTENNFILITAGG